MHSIIWASRRSTSTEQFRERYARINQKLGRKQYLVPYLMSSHPGATLDDAIMLAQYLNRIGYMPEQVQDFYPTPARCPPRCIIPASTLAR